jgi:hypothetical protein
MYCDCERPSETMAADDWTKCFNVCVWISILALSLLTQCAASLSHALSNGKQFWVCFIEMYFNVMGTVIRQGKCACFVVASFSLGMIVVSSLYENILTSLVVVQRVKPQMALSELIHSGYKVSYSDLHTGPGDRSWTLREAFELSKTQFTLNNVQIMTEEMHNNPKTLINKFAYFRISSQRSMKRVLWRVKSKAPSFCSCNLIRYQLQSFHTFSTYAHPFKFKMFYCMNLLIQAGIDQLFSQTFSDVSSDILDETKANMMSSTTDDSYISLLNLAPMLIFLSALLLASILIFAIEIRGALFSLSMKIGERILKPLYCRNLHNIAGVMCKTNLFIVARSNLRYLRMHGRKLYNNLYPS